MNYYNEFDPKAADWIEDLIKEELIPNGKVDRRSIRDVQPGDLEGFTQCHFFAGIAGWSLALRLAGVSPETRLWTGSCPCQPFSVAGKGLGQKDERHLWPTFFGLIKARRPDLVFGEQVASAVVLGKAGQKATGTTEPVWIDGVRADLEAAHYTFGAGDLSSAGVNAPHIRQRAYWVAYAFGDRWREGSTSESRQQGGAALFDNRGEQGGVGNPFGPGLERHWRPFQQPISQRRKGEERHGSETGGVSFWSDTTWHHCRDGKVRRIPASAQPILQRMANGLSCSLDECGPEGGFPLAPSFKGRSAILKGYGNAINPILAAEFIRAAFDCINE